VINVTMHKEIDALEVFCELNDQMVQATRTSFIDRYQCKIDPLPYGTYTLKIRIGDSSSQVATSGEKSLITITKIS
jgi:hypothetical protein